MKDRKKVIVITLVILVIWFIVQCVFNEPLYQFTTKFKQGLLEISRKAEETNELRNENQKELTEAEPANNSVEVIQNKENTDPTAATTQVQETEPEVVTTDPQANEAPPIEENAQTQEPDIGDENQNTFTAETITELPDSILNTVEYWKKTYPNMTIGVGLYKLDGTTGYEYNAQTPINSACTIKAAYALYVLKECQRRGIDIWDTFLTYQSWHSDDGSGDIQLYASYGAQYSIADLVRLLLQVSDNVAYNMLLEQFPLNDFYVENSALGGQNDWSKWGKASVQQRKNEWIEIWNYVNSSAWYAQVLRDDLTGTQYAYFLQGMQNWHNYMQKSGWTEDNPEYPATCEAAIIDDRYILIVLTEDYTDYKMGHIDVLQSIGGAVESYWYAQDGYY
ncbi:MAG: serine hydrolase [Clostridia bacterium]|nr:serine hydrolase [Clostridia bacterium]